jgi:hypothetical protein
VVYAATINDEMWLWFSSIYSHPFEETNYGLRRGDGFANQVGISWLPNENAQLFCSVDLDYSKKSHGGRVASLAENSGARTLSLAPGFTFDIVHGWGIEGTVHIPVDHHVRGRQLVGDIDYFFGFYKSF